MIARIFFDLDETLIHTSVLEPNQEHVSFNIDGDWNTYYTIIRPASYGVIEFARNLVGKENVFVLTIATRAYAQEVNRLANWNFPHDQIFAREDLEAHEWPTAYGSYAKMPNNKISSSDNVIIDNQMPRFNEGKICFIGISKTWATNYLQVRDYFGVNFPDDPFQEDVEEFLLDRYEDLK